jgi:probable HAF family extracellular repeat protein
VSFPADQFLLVSGISGAFSDLVFTAPASGVYHITTSFSGDQNGIGVVVAVVADGSVIFESTVNSLGELVLFATDINLAAGATLAWAVGPGGGLQNTGVDATVTSMSSSPEPSTLAMAFAAFLGLAGYRARNLRCHAVARRMRAATFMISRTAFVFILCVVATATITKADSLVIVSIVSLGSLGGSYSYAYGLSATGQVVGGAATADGAEHAFLYSRGVMADLGTLGGSSSVAFGINASGQQVVGQSATANGDGHAFVSSGGTITDLGITLGGSVAGACCVNDAGTIAGEAYSVSNGDNRAFVYSAGSTLELPTLGGYISYAGGISSVGDVAGTSYTDDPRPGGIEQAYLYSDGVITPLGTLGGAQSEATGVNNSKQVVGFSEITGYESNSSFATGTHAFLYSGGSMVDLATLGGDTSEAYGIDAAGEVVGYSDTPTGAMDAFYWSGGTMTDLNSLLPANSGWHLEVATAIDDSGQITGYGISPTGQTEAFLLDTSNSPEPASMALLCVGTAFLALMRKKL